MANYCTNCRKFIAMEMTGMSFMDAFSAKQLPWIHIEPTDCTTPTKRETFASVCHGFCGPECEPDPEDIRYEQVAEKFMKETGKELW